MLTASLNSPSDTAKPRNEPLVSVIIPSYNHAQYIDRTIQSVFEQEYTNWELIVCDDGSKDNSRQILEKYRDHNRVTLLLNEENRGQGIVLNEGIDASKGDYICFLSSDDIYFPNKLRLQVDKLNNCPEDVGFVYSYGATLYDDTGKIEPDYWPVHTGDIFRQLFVRNCVFPISPMLRRSVFNVERFWDGYAAEGEGIYARIARHYRVEFVPEVTCAMRRHTYNIGRKFEFMYYECLRWLERYVDTPGLPPDVVALVKKRHAWHHRLAGLSYIRLSNEYEKGQAALLRALDERPLYWLDWKVLAGLAICFWHVKLKSYRHANGY